MDQSLKVLHRKAKSLNRESEYDIELHTGTYYPCTQEELNASGGLNRRTAVESKHFKDKRKWFARPNGGPFIYARDAAREIYNHNDLRRLPSAGEEDAIERLREGFQRAAEEPWGPDLAIKAFCDLDKVFFDGRLKGHVCLTWRPGDYFGVDHLYGVTYYIPKGQAVIQLNAGTLLSYPEDRLPGPRFECIFATLLHEMIHAHQDIRAIAYGPGGWLSGKAGGHGKNFGTMMYAVNKRAWKLFGLRGDPEKYPHHDYVGKKNPSPSAPKQPHPHNPPPRYPSEPAARHKSGRRLYKEASKDVFLNSGTHYPCQQSDLDVTGGLIRQLYPENRTQDQSKSRKEWFPHNKNRGPFVSARQASLDVFEHNQPHRKKKRSAAELAAIGCLSRAIHGVREGGDDWGPDMIIKAFCDLDLVFFNGKLRGHVCLRWLPDWSPPGQVKFATTVYLGKGKCAINMNADTILFTEEPFEQMFASILHEMCHAYAHTQVEETDMLSCASHGKNFGTKYYAVVKRVRELFGRSFRDRAVTDFPRHKYEKGEGFPLGR